MAEFNLDALAAKYGGQPVQPTDDLDALAAQYGGQPVAPRGSAGAAPEPVDTVAIPAGAGARQPLSVGVNALPEAQRRPDLNLAAVGRSAVDNLTFNLADEAYAALMSGSISGPEYDRIMAEEAAIRQNEAMTAPESQDIGTALGFLGSLALPAGALGKVTGLGKQTAVASGLGAGTTALSGYGAAGTGEGAPTLAEDLILGGSIGAVVPVGSSVARKAAQIVGVKPSTAAVDSLKATGLTPRNGSMDWLRQEAADFYARTGRGARLSDILPEGVPGRLSGPISRSREAGDRVIGDLRATREATTETVPARLAADRSGETALRLETIKQGDADFGAFKAVERPLSDINAIELDRKVLAPLGKALDEKFLGELKDRASRGVILGDDMDRLRRKISDVTDRNADPLKEAELQNVQDNFLAIYTDIFPEAAPAVERYARGMAAADGAKFGTRAAGRADATATAEELAMMAEKAPSQLAGVAPGARQGLETAARSTFGESYRLAQRIEESPGYQDQIRQLVPEAEAFIAGALADKRAIDNIAALAKIPKEKVADLGNDVESIANVAAAAGFNVGGAFKAAVVRNLLSMALPVGEKAANKITDMLLDPRQRDAAIRALEKAGLPKTGLREVLSGALITAGRTTLTAPSDTALKEPQQ